MTQLLTCLQNLEQDRGAMAALRHALSEQQQRCYKYLARMGCKFESDLDMLRFEILAYCWGHHSSHSEAVGNLGRSMRRITGGDEDHSFNRRFERLLACDSLDEVAEQVRGIVSLLKRDSIPINYDRLSDDLYWLSRNLDRVKREWSGGFYIQQEVAA